VGGASCVGGPVFGEFGTKREPGGCGGWGVRTKTGARGGVKGVNLGGITGKLTQGIKGGPLFLVQGEFNGGRGAVLG